MVRDNALAVFGPPGRKDRGEEREPAQPRNASKSVEGFGTPTAATATRAVPPGRLRLLESRLALPVDADFDAVKRDTLHRDAGRDDRPRSRRSRLLNDPVYVECAKMLGQRMQKDREALGRAAT